MDRVLRVLDEPYSFTGLLIYSGRNASYINLNAKLRKYLFSKTMDNRLNLVKIDVARKCDWQAVTLGGQSKNVMPNIPFTRLF